MKKILYVFGILILIVVIIYLIPARRADFFSLYPRQDRAAQSLKEFYGRPTRTVTVNDVTWKYYVGGNGPRTILFLHGMGGAYDLWWQQVTAFEPDFRVITYTLPESIDNLEAVLQGILAILDKENVKTFSAVGTSMGGYITQYLMKRIPERIEKAVLGNTFPPNDDIIKENRTRSTIVRLLPEIAIQWFGNRSLHEKLLPAAGGDSLLAAFLPSLPFSKKGFLGRYAVTTDFFVINPCAYPVRRIPKLIIESDNDPLVNEKLRNELKEYYPDAEVYTFHNAGHFPYINEADTYNEVLRRFLTAPNEVRAIEQTIRRYFEGRSRADTALLARAFHPRAQLYGKLQAGADAPPVIIPLQDYLRAVVETGPREVTPQILSIDRHGSIAYCKVQMSYPQKRYVDYLTLVKDSGEWRIITKTFTVSP